MNGTSSISKGYTLITLLQIHPSRAAINFATFGEAGECPLSFKHANQIDEWFHRYKEFLALCERKRFLGSARIKYAVCGEAPLGMPWYAWPEQRRFAKIVGMASLISRVISLMRLMS
jgi:hypothetical protein